ncbi:MAG: hypothetical protein ACYDHZ_02405 [Dehalococcoidia bacterium]
MMRGAVEKEKKHLISNVLKEIEDKSKAHEFQKIIKETIYEARTKPQKAKWFDIFKNK